MEKTNSKIITLSFAIVAFLVGLVVSLLMKAFAGAFAVVARANDVDLIRHGLPLIIGFGLFAYCQFNSKVVAWGDEVVTEVKKVVWPSRKDTTAMTIVVCIMVLISSVIISSFDMISGYVINTLVR
ncbi:preprotein translocase subunit SecE [Bdellovibrio sp. HCB337]|uniref:preprotein translocase subunit SecE n=1 Tax=Bdellovibrio sp. HCB337 TaxID=3394358 RepID=UPI0039A47696